MRIALVDKVIMQTAQGEHWAEHGLAMARVDADG